MQGKSLLGLFHLISLNEKSLRPLKFADSYIQALLAFCLICSCLKWCRGTGFFLGTCTCRIPGRAQQPPVGCEWRGTGQLWVSDRDLKAWPQTHRAPSLPQCALYQLFNSVIHQHEVGKPLNNTVLVLGCAVMCLDLLLCLRTQLVLTCRSHATLPVEARVSDYSPCWQLQDSLDRACLLSLGTYQGWASLACC